MSRTTEQSLESAIARTRQVTVKKTICGVDVSKARLDACVDPAGIFASFDNNASGIAQLAAFCRQHSVSLVVMEASGGYERRAFLALWQAGVSCALTNPRSVRRVRRYAPNSASESIDVPILCARCRVDGGSGEN
jgi:transposase